MLIGLGGHRGKGAVLPRKAGLLLPGSPHLRRLPRSRQPRELGAQPKESSSSPGIPGPRQHGGFRRRLGGSERPPGNLPSPTQVWWGGVWLRPHCTLRDVSLSVSKERITPKLHTSDTSGSPASRGSNATKPLPSTVRMGGSWRSSLGSSFFFLGPFCSCGERPGQQTGPSRDSAQSAHSHHTPGHLAAWLVPSPPLSPFSPPCPSRLFPSGLSPPSLSCPSPLFLSWQVAEQQQEASLQARREPRGQQSGHK